MALGTIGAAIAGSALSAGLSYGANKLFGGSRGDVTGPLQNFQPVGFSGGGLNSSFGPDGNIVITPTAERLGAVRNLAGSFGPQADQIAALRAKVAPGISELRSARLAEIEDARTAALGNLRENLSRRRVLGSSFGQDALTRAELEFGGAKERVAAESFLQEFEATQQLINQEFGIRRQEFQTNLDELNLEAQLAAGMTGKATDALSRNAQVLAALNAQEAAGAGKFFGQTFQPVFSAIGQGAGKFFGGGGGGPSSFVPVGDYQMPMFG